MDLFIGRFGMQKKSWTTPELIVLVRSNPEEAVLRGCKRNVADSVGPSKPTCKAATGSNACDIRRAS